MDGLYDNAPLGLQETEGSLGGETLSATHDAAAEDTAKELGEADATAPADAPSSDTACGEGSAEDILELCREFPELRASELFGAASDKRYAELRRIGLSPREAFLATSKPKGSDNRSHLVTEVPSGAKVHASGMTSWEMSCARAIFSDLPESEIKRLYTKVTTQQH